MTGGSRIVLSHSFDVTPREALAIQRQLGLQVLTTDSFGAVQFVAGVDVGFEDQGAVTRAAVAVLRYSTLELEEYAIARRPTRFPYVPGLLSFRELPAVLEALERLRQTPDILLCDGQGLAHPRRCGIACHLGVLTDLPAIGVAKTRLVGFSAPVPDVRGAWQPLYDGAEVVGAVLRTRQGVKPLYVSCGHRISLNTAIGLVMGCTRKYRLPETTRAAHRLASGPATASDHG